jgi:hypothetical protein
VIVALSSNLTISKQLSSVAHVQRRSTGKYRLYPSYLVNHGSATPLVSRDGQPPGARGVGGRSSTVTTGP